MAVRDICRVSPELHLDDELISKIIEDIIHLLEFPLSNGKALGEMIYNQEYTDIIRRIINIFLKDLLNIIKKRKGKKLIAVLTEFGTELKGYRKNLARLLESQNSDKQIIIPADLEFAIDFSEPGNEKFLCSKCRQLLSEKEDNSKLSSLTFHNISEIIYFEDLQTEMIKYQGNEKSCGLSIDN